LIQQSVSSVPLVESFHSDFREETMIILVWLPLSAREQSNRFIQISEKTMIILVWLPLSAREQSNRFIQISEKTMIIHGVGCNDHGPD